LNRPSFNRRTLALLAVLIPLGVLFAYGVMRSGPLAPVPVTVTQVENLSITPSLFGIGVIEARYLHRIGPTVPGRIQNVLVDVGDSVQVGQMLAEIDPIDLGERILAQEAALKRVEANIRAAEAQVRDMAARKDFAETQTKRYAQLLGPNLVSKELAEIKRQEHETAIAGHVSSKADLEALRQELVRLNADYRGLLLQRGNLQLTSPVNGQIMSRYADPGTTVVAGQPVVAVADPALLWVNVRFDQLNASGLKSGLPARVVLRSRNRAVIDGTILRVEPVADTITEEILAKIIFNKLPEPPPPIGELAEVTVNLAELSPLPVVPNAALRRVNGQLGLWIIKDGDPEFTPVKTGSSSLEGRIQIIEGANAGDVVVVYSLKAITRRSRIKIVDRLPGINP
jgi:RND family efflux transporter MFP subunit